MKADGVGAIRSFDAGWLLAVCEAYRRGKGGNVSAAEVEREVMALLSDRVVDPSPTMKWLVHLAARVQA